MADAEPILLDNNFVIDQIQPVATGWPSLIHPTQTSRRLLLRLDSESKSCLDLFDLHRGIKSCGPVPSDHIAERRLLNFALDITGKVLNLESSISLLAKVIEVDWKAHTELLKEKRYRDHITHPVRVTATGWWLLHRNGGAFLKEMAAEYQCRTRSFRERSGIDCQRHRWEEIVEYAWLAAGILHDSAYPLEYFLRAGLGFESGYGNGFCIFKPLRQRFATQRGRTVVLRHLADSWFLDQVPDIEDRMAELGGTKRFNHAHALTGALHHMLHMGHPRLASLQGLVVQLAARAIVTHHDPEDTAIESDPLALLLFIADNLQAWGRLFLHREADSNSSSGAHRIRPLIECRKIVLDPVGGGYLAKFQMNDRDRSILKAKPYNWAYDKFSEPYARVEHLLQRHPRLPQITLSQSVCIEPAAFRQDMGVPDPRR